MKRTLFTAMNLMVISISIISAQSSILAGRIEIFGKAQTPPVHLESENGWTPITTLDWSALALSSGNATRRWRLSTSYEHAASTGPATIQIRFRDGSTSPVFTHPWSEGRHPLDATESNWYQGAMDALSSGGRSLVEARLVAPPRTPLSGTLYSVTLEAWEEEIVVRPKENLRLAAARPIGTDQMLPSAKPSEKSLDAATHFALQFLKSCLEGDLPTYYRNQSDTVHSLADGRVLSKYRTRPPAPIPGVENLADFTQEFSYGIHPVDDVRALFPDWFSSERDWVPTSETYLFLGQEFGASLTIPQEVDYLAFLVGKDEEGEWKVLGRPKF